MCNAQNARVGSGSSSGRSENKCVKKKRKTARKQFESCDGDTTLLLFERACDETSIKNHYKPVNHKRMHTRVMQASAGRLGLWCSRRVLSAPDVRSTCPPRRDSN